jgi:alkylation response protein AidB-like acyl-CoA dehydrogenase
VPIATGDRDLGEIGSSTWSGKRSDLTRHAAGDPDHGSGGVARGVARQVVVKELRDKARAKELWCPFAPKEYAGMGLGHLANAILQIEVGRSFSHLGAWALSCMDPQDATMLTLAEHGTPEQKQKYLPPLVNGDIRICFSMTEKAAGADATGMQTTAAATVGDLF